MNKKLAGLTTALLAIALTTVGAVAPVSAHTPAVTGSATCQSDGTYSVNWKFSAVNVPTGSESHSIASAQVPSSSVLGGAPTKDGKLVLSVYTSEKSAYPSASVHSGNWSTSFTQTGIVGTTSAAKVTVTTNWKGAKDSYSGSATGTVALDGKCGVVVTPPTTPPTSTPPTTTPPTAPPTTTPPTTPPITTPPTTTPPTAKPCIPDSAVSYTYLPEDNAGVVTVKNVAGSTGELCEPLYIVATSWKFTTNDYWPQARDVVNVLPVITKPGNYPYIAKVTCGQGDIYAGRTPVTYPTPTLNGPSDPYKEVFLSSMGFGGPGTTVTLTPECYTPPTVTPVIPTAKSITACDTDGSIIVPADTATIHYTLNGNGKTGINTVTAKAIAPAVLTGYPAGGWALDLGQRYDCPTPPQVTPVTPTATPITTCGTDGSISVPADTATIDYTLTGNGKTGINTVTAVAIAPAVLVGYPVGGWTFDLGQRTECPPVVTPTTPVATIITACGTDGSVIVPADSATIDYTLTGNGKTGVNTVTAVAIAPAVLTGYPVGGWTFDLGQRTECPLPPQAVTAAADVTAQTCPTVGDDLDLTSTTVGSDALTDGDQLSDADQLSDTADSVTPISGKIHVALGGHVSYTINGAPVTSEYTNVEPGTYTVVATADAGYTLTGTSSWALVVESADCLPTFAAWEADAFATSPVCVDGSVVSGNITVVFPEGAESAVRYYIGSTEVTSAVTAVAPGTYTVRAVPRNASDTILGGGVFSLTVAAAPTGCLTLTEVPGTPGTPTLATTGSNVAPELGIAALLLLLGAAAVFMRRRSHKTAE